MVVLSASQLVVLATVAAVSVVVIWPAVDVAVLWLVLVVVQVFVSSPDPTNPSRPVIPCELVLSHT